MIERDDPPVRREQIEDGFEILRAARDAVEKQQCRTRRVALDKAERGGAGRTMLGVFHCDVQQPWLGSKADGVTRIRDVGESTYVKSSAYLGAQQRRHTNL